MHNPTQPTITSKDVLRPTLVEVNLNRLAANFANIRQFVGPAKVMPVLKANAYGHGLVEIARFMQELNADYLGVAVLEEGVYLREQGVTIPILVMGAIWANQIHLFIEHDLTITASSIEKLEQVNEVARRLGKKARVHLKIDTGMERVGVHYYSARPFLETALHCSQLEVEGIYSHFANADMADLSSSRLQLDRFLQVLRFYEDQRLPMPMRHIANSGGVLQLPESHLDMVRPGILLYGVYPSAEVVRSVEVRPALAWKSRVVYFKVVQAETPVSYGWRWKSPHMVRLVTVPVGYGDGYFRAMTGKAEVIIRDRRYPVVGTICMDQMMVNIEWDSAYNGDEVILIGQSENTSISAEELAAWAGTIPYEILTNINTRVPRVYVR